MLFLRRTGKKITERTIQTKLKKTNFHFLKRKCKNEKRLLRTQMTNLVQLHLTSNQRNVVLLIRQIRPNFAKKTKF